MLGLAAFGPDDAPDDWQPSPEAVRLAVAAFYDLPRDAKYRVLRSWEPAEDRPLPSQVTARDWTGGSEVYRTLLVEPSMDGGSTSFRQHFQLGEQQPVSIQIGEGTSRDTAVSLLMLAARELLMRWEEAMAAPCGQEKSGIANASRSVACRQRNEEAGVATAA
jgi:hypothetical protein